MHRARRGMLQLFTAVDAVGQIQHILQHGLRLLRIFVGAGNVSHHLFQAVGTISQHGRYRLGNVAALCFQVFQHVFEMVPQGCQPSQADDGARAFERMRHPLGRSNIVHAGFARAHFAHQLHQHVGLVGRFLKEAFHQLLIGIFRHVQCHVLGQSDGLALLLIATQTHQIGHGLQLLHDLTPAVFTQGVRRRMQVIQQPGGCRQIFQMPQVVHHQCGPAPQKVNQRRTFCLLYRCQQQGVFKHMVAHRLQTGEAGHLGRLAHTLHLVAVLIQCMQKTCIVQLQLVQVIEIDVQLRDQVFYLSRQCIN